MDQRLIPNPSLIAIPCAARAPAARVALGSLFVSIALIGCTRSQDPAVLASTALPDLPRPVSNNAVAGLRTSGEQFLFSFLGLGAGRGWQDVSSSAWFLARSTGVWRPLPDIPGGEGRLAATAVLVRGRIYVIGGYTVAEDGSERSTAELDALDVGSGTWFELAPMPVPVDDTVAVAHANRYIYLISGWHDTDNVADVQFYDVETDRWAQATAFPGTPVFGHAGGIVDGHIVVCDGVRLTGGNPRRYEMSDECWLGVLNDIDPADIAWTRIDPHPGESRYRMAAAGGSAKTVVVFAGGSAIAYNYDGIGYDGRPAEPSDGVFAFDVVARRWRELGRLDIPTMDHRGLVWLGDELFLIGGMRAGQEVSDEVLSFRLPE